MRWNGPHQLGSTNGPLKRESGRAAPQAGTVALIDLRVPARAPSPPRVCVGSTLVSRCERVSFAVH